MNQTISNWRIIEGDSPIVATAIHCGHNLRRELNGIIAISPEQRIAYENPHTDQWVDVAESRVVVNMSRFEVDLNCPRNNAFYSSTDDAWGLEIWKAPPPNSAVESSLKLYDAFYGDVEKLLKTLASKFDRIVVLDFHSYRPRTDDSNEPAAELEPDINVCTGTMYRRRWVNLVERLLGDLSCQSAENGPPLTVGENAAFLGGTFPQRIHETFPDTVCVLSIYVKQALFFDVDMGSLDETSFERLENLFKACAAGLLDVLGER